MGHPEKSRVFTEEDWSNVDGGLAPYQISKTLSEKAAWEFVAEHGGVELAVVNPVGVFGPVLGSDYSPSLGLVRWMLDGELPALPKFAMGYVDVRDVADLHLRAMTDPVAAGERFLAISGHSLWVREIAAILHDRLGDRASKVPTRELPVWTARALACVNPGLRILRPQLGRNFDATSEKAQRYALTDYSTDGADSTLVTIHATGSPGWFFWWATPLMARKVRDSIAADLERLRGCLKSESLLDTSSKVSCSGCRYGRRSFVVGREVGGARLDEERCDGPVPVVRAYRRRWRR